MFKFNIPMTIVLSSGSLVLLVLGSLLLATTAYTSDIQTPATNNPAIRDESTTTDENSSPPASDNSSRIAGLPKVVIPQDGRRRSGRLYGHQQSTLDNYATAYAAANAPSSAEQQSTVQANDASSFASFGELPPGTGSPTSATGSSRQLTGSEYAPHSAAYYTGYMSPGSSAASYTGHQSSGSSNYYPSTYYHRSPAQVSPFGYPMAGSGYSDRQSSSNYYDRAGYLSAGSSPPIWASSSPSGGLMSSASSALAHWTGGFTLSEVICGIIAISIGAVILGAPFFLIYLALMGNFSGSGTLSLTNPTQPTATNGGSTTINGRRKRWAIYDELPSFPRSSTGDRQHASEFGILADSVVSQLSPFVDLQQVSSTFRRLVDSIEKYSRMKPEGAKKKSA